MFKIRDAVLQLGRNHDPGYDWSGVGNFRFANPKLIMRDSEAMMFGIQVDSKSSGHFSTDARIIVGNAIGNIFTEDGKYRACNMNLDWHGTIPSSSYQPDSCFVQLQYHHFDEVISCADLYCGGFGGWQHAAEFLATYFETPFQYLWSIDRDPAATKCHSRNFEEMIFSEEVVEHYPLPKNDKFVICGNCDYVLLNRVNFQRPTKGATASFPCPPWSRGSKGKGFEYKDGGLAILEILRAGIVNNWEFILLENVDAIVEHFHYAWIRTYIDDAGYYIAYSNISCISDISPAKRKRWVCVIVQKHLNNRIPKSAFEWTVPTAPTLRNSKIIPSCLPEQHEKDLTLSNELLNIYGNPAFAPIGLKTRFSIDKRIKHGYEQMLTATATYGRQHELPDEVIRTESHACGKGIYADLIQGVYGPRFWSPIEIAMTMIIFKKTFFPLSITESHHFVGNAISTLHAIKVLCAFLTGFSGKQSPCFDDVFHMALMKRLHMENSRIYIWDEWIVVEPISFRIEDIEISPTLPMSRSVIVILGNQRVKVEIPLHSTIIEILHSLGLSPDNVYVSWKPAHIRARIVDQQIPGAVDEFVVTEKFQIHTTLSQDSVPFVQECIRQFRASAIETSAEPVFFPVHVCKDGERCLTLQVWACLKVQFIAEICWKAGIAVGCDIACIHICPSLKDGQVNVGWWHISEKCPCEIRVITKPRSEHQQFSLMIWDDTRKSPLLGQRIGEATHPGPGVFSTLEFKTENKKHCVARKDINTRISKHDIAACLGVAISDTKLWDSINRKMYSWEQLNSCIACTCHVKPINWNPPQECRRPVTFWDLLPTELPNIAKCKIDRNHDFSYGVIHRLTKVEIFDEQFQLILREMNDKFAQVSTDEHSPFPVTEQHFADHLLWKQARQPFDNHAFVDQEPDVEDCTSSHPNTEYRDKPKQAAGNCKRCCTTKHATKHQNFWIHLPIGRHCVTIDATEGHNIADLVGKAFQKVNVFNHDYILKGCFCSVNSKICDFQMPVEKIPGNVIRVRFRGLLGGGKDDIMRKASAKLGELLIHKGLPINAVAPKVQKIIEKIGLSQVHQALQNQNEIHAWRKIEQLAHVADFVIFNDKEKKGLSATLIQRAIKKKNKGNSEVSKIAVDQFTLPLGIFVNEDQSETPVLPIDKLRAGSHGVILATEEKVLPWLQSGAKSSADELGVVVLGNPTTNVPEVYQPTSICFAAVNHDGKECILRGTLMQLGGKKVGLNQHFKVEGENAAMTTCSLTAFASDFDQESFASLISSPAKFMLSQLPSDTIRNAISSVWGRSFMRDGKKVPNLEAESVQVHISIKSDKIPDLLKCSGTCNIYITPKTASGLFDPKYHLIWTDLSKIAIEQKANEIQNHLGYIKGRKGFALRFLTADAPDGFKSLFPAKTFEPPVAVNALYKLQPVPYGILPDVLIEACKAIKWNIKPIKRSGNSWLVGADKQSPNKFLIIDGTTILVKEVEKTNSGRTPICLAGPRPRMIPKDKGPDPLAVNDPWASFKPSIGSSSQHSPPVQSNGMTIAPIQNQGATRGPVEERFKSQESRIQRLEQKLDDAVQQVHAQQEETKKGFEKQQKEINDMQHAFKADLIGLQKGITMSFQDSLKQAIQQQTQDMKKLLLESPTGASPAKKQAKLGSS